MTTNETVMVTGAGGPAGIGVLRSLAGRARTVGVDADPLATGMRLADYSATLPLANHPDFIPRLLDTSAEFGVTALCSTVAEELPALLAATDQLDAADVHYWFPPMEAVEVCLDKWQFAEAMDRAGIPHPATSLDTDTDTDMPWILKPRFGRGSRGVALVSDPNEVDVLFGRIDDPIVQAAIDGREFTVDTLVTEDGIAGSVARWRLETKSGISTKGETFSDQRVDQLVADVLSAIGYLGPANVQGFVTPDDEVVIIEVNPRFSGGLALSLHAGADFVGAYLARVQGERVEPGSLVGKPGVIMMRHFEEIFE